MSGFEGGVREGAVWHFVLTPVHARCVHTTGLSALIRADVDDDLSFLKSHVVSCVCARESVMCVRRSVLRVSRVCD